MNNFGVAALQTVVTSHLTLVPGLEFLAVLADHALIVFPDF